MLLAVPVEFRRHLNNKKIKHKKEIHHSSLTMKHKEKRLEYARQYQTMSSKEWQKVVFSEGKKFNSNGPDDFQKYWHAKKITQQGIMKEDLLWSGEPSYLQENLNSGR